MCGGDLQISADRAIGTCLYCGSTLTLPRIDSEKKARLFNRANQYRQNCEFDKAYRAYEAIVEDDDKEAEAYWGLILAEYGVEYVEDPMTGRRMPTCHRTQTKFITESTNYKLACKYADSESRFMYEDEAETIDKIQKRIIAISAKEDPYDVFICYKETDEVTGGRTQDSLLAYEVYEEFTKHGIRSFMARVTLADKIGQDYEPYIYSALSSAKVMIVVATNGENCDAVWVKNEWMRFLSFMKEDDSKTIVPIYRSMSPYEFPTELTKFQAQDMSKVGAIQDLTIGVQKLVGMDKHDNTSARIRRMEQENRKSRRSTNRLIAVLAALLVITLIAGGLFVYTNSSGYKYQEAVKKAEAGQYYEAAALFYGLNDYEDSHDLYEEYNKKAQYDDAAKRIEQGDYYNAAVIYNNLGEKELSAKYDTLYNIQEIQKTYFDLEQGESLEGFGAYEGMPISWMCKKRTEDQLILVCNSIVPTHKHGTDEDAEELLSEGNVYQKMIIDLQDGSYITEYNIDEYKSLYPTPSERKVNLVGKSISTYYRVRSTESFNNNVGKYNNIDRDGNIEEEPVPVQYAYPGFRPILYLSLEPITDI